MAGRGNRTANPRIMIGLESDDFARLSDGGATGYPGDPPTLRGLFCANPELRIGNNVIELNAATGQSSVTTSKPTTWDCSFAADCYIRSVAGAGFDEATHNLLSLFFPAVVTRTGRPAVAEEGWTNTTVTLQANAAATPGEGFEILPFTGGGVVPDKALVRFVRSVAGAVITFHPPLSDEHVAILNASDTVIGYGRTYAFGTNIEESATVEMRTEGLTRRIFGCVPSTLTVNMVAGESGTFRAEMVSPYGVRDDEPGGGIGVTAEPAGEWLACLNMDYSFHGAAGLIDLRSLAVTFAHDPQRNVSAGNALGVSGMKRGGGARVTGAAVFSGYDRTQDAAFRARQKGIIVATLGAGTPGNTVAVAIMAAGRTSIEDGSESDLLTQSMEYVADAFALEGDGSYSGDVQNSIARMFFAAGV